jgi:DNA-binding LacI/PurR family transcriptional regulator
MAKQVTLKQVAAHAGVSYQTVSKVLNHQIQISKEAEDRIWEAVHTLGYRPNQLARSLRSRSSRLIGYSWEPSPPDQANTILDQFLASMTRAAEDAGYHLLAFTHHYGEKWVESYRELIDTSRVDAFVLSSIEFQDPRILFLKNQNFPFVAFGRSNPDWDIPFVDIDGALGIQLAVEHLVERRHQRIAVLAWPEGSRVGQNRMEGYLRSMRTAGINVLPEWVARGEGRFAFGYEATGEFLNWPAADRPTGIIAFNDAMAVGAMNAIQERGLEVGVDIAVTGFDDAPMAQYLHPPLTSVRQPVWEVGQRLMRMLLASLNGNAPEERQVLLPPQLIVRESSGSQFQWPGRESSPDQEGGWGDSLTRSRGNP